MAVATMPRKADRPYVELSPPTHHGVPTLELHVGDPIPTPRAPTRYAVRVTPDLARYLLTFNHERNRRMKRRSVMRYAADMRMGLWRFTPESVVFSVGRVLENGQNRLMAITEYGEPVWLVLDFGWPDDLIHIIDRGAARTNHDALRVEGIPNGAALAAAISRVAAYNATVGLMRSWAGIETPSSARAIETYNEDPDGWQLAITTGQRVYNALDQGLSPSAWGTAYRVIGAVRPDEVAAFFEEVAEGTGKPGSATRQLADFNRRRGVTFTKTGDSREPIENVIRAFNAYRSGKSMGFVSRPGFALSRVR